MSERPTIRPVTLPRLVEVTNVCDDDPRSTDAIETELDVSHRRARETILEAVRLDFLTEHKDGGDGETDPEYATTDVGSEFLAAVTSEAWSDASEILKLHSPHYGAFLAVVADLEAARPGVVLERLDTGQAQTEYEFNQTSLDVLGDWGERLGAIQRNAFTGAYYRPLNRSVSSAFPSVLLETFHDLEETTGVNMNQHYVSIPELREHTCERLQCTRQAFDKGLLTLASQNVGRVELSGAPVDTGAKEAAFGIKQIALTNDDGLVSTDQSTDRVMAGVEQFDKQYYYLAIHDEDLTFTQETTQ
jgi:hypothetical protein